MKKIILFTILLTMLFIFLTPAAKAEGTNLPVNDLLNNWKISGDLSLFATFNNPEKYEDSKLNFLYFQIYAEKHLENNLTLFLSLAVNNASYKSDGNNYETDILVDTALLIYSLNDSLAINIGREIINYGYQNPISVINDKFAFIPAINDEYFGGYILRGDGAKITLRNSIIDTDIAYYNIPTNDSLQSKSLFAKISKTFDKKLTASINLLSTNGPDKTITGTDDILIYGPDIKYKNELIEFESELMFVNRKTDFETGNEQTIERLGFYAQLTVNILAENKLYSGARFDYVEPFTVFEKETDKYASGVIGSYLHENLLIRTQYKTNIKDGKDTQIGLLATVAF